MKETKVPSETCRQKNRRRWRIGSLRTSKKYDAHYQCIPLRSLPMIPLLSKCSKTVQNFKRCVSISSWQPTSSCRGDNLRKILLQSTWGYSGDGSDAGIVPGWGHNHLLALCISGRALRRRIGRSCSIILFKYPISRWRLRSMCWFWPSSLPLWA